MSERRLAEGVWVLPLRTPTLPPATATNTVIVAGDAVAVIEPATPHAAERARIHALLDAIDRPVAGIFITHHHADHVGYATGLRERTGAPIFAHPETAARVAFDVDHEIEDGARVELGGRAIVGRFTPGHAPGHLCYFDTASSIVHGGDLVAGEGTILIDPRDDGDLAVYLDSLRALTHELRSSWPEARLVPAHGPVQDRPTELLEYYVAHRLAREAKLIDAFGLELELDQDTLLRRTYDDVPEAVLPIAAGSLEAHLRKLEAEGRVRRDAGVVRRIAS